MSQDFALSELKAYTIFISETAKHIDSAKECFGECDEVDPVDREHFALLFHRIKGGAGMFGHQDVYELSGKVENLLLAEMEDNLGEVKELIEQLDSLWNQMD